MNRVEDQIERPLVSVIVPNFNHARFLKERLDSIFNQTFQNVEVILLDDCSTDESREILTSYEQHPLVTHCVFNDSNSGSTFKQWEKGLNLAKGDWIWIAESDDSADPEFLEELLNLVGNNDQITLAFSRSYVIDEVGKNRGISRWAEELSPNRWNEDFINSGKKECEHFLIHRNTIPNASGVLFRKDIGIKYIRQVERYKYCGDWLFWSKLAYDGKVAYCAKALNKFRRYPKATSLVRSEARIIQRMIEYREVIEEISSFPQFDTPIAPEHQWIIDEWFATRKHFSLRTFYSPPFYPELKKQFLKQLTLKQKLVSWFTRII